MKALLDAAVRQGQVRHRRPVDFWITEFGWDSSPPDPGAVPVRIHARWVAEAVYEMWRVGVRVISWHQLRDSPFPASSFQAGLYALGPGGGLSADSRSQRWRRSAFHSSPTATRGRSACGGFLPRDAAR